MSKPVKPTKPAKIKDPKDAMSAADQLDPAKVKAARIAAFKPTKTDKVARRQTAITSWEAS